MACSVFKLVSCSSSCHPWRSLPKRRSKIDSSSPAATTRCRRQAERLWEHWEQPGIRWFAGGHVSFYWSSEVAPFVDHRLHKSGFVVLDE